MVFFLGGGGRSTYYTAKKTVIVPTTQLLTVIVIDADIEVSDVNNYINIVGRHMQTEVLVLLKDIVVDYYNAGTDSTRQAAYTAGREGKRGLDCYIIHTSYKGRYVVHGEDDIPIPQLGYQ